jgi:hypothetical protein
MPDLIQTISQLRLRASLSDHRPWPAPAAGHHHDQSIMRRTHGSDEYEFPTHTSFQ